MKYLLNNTKIEKSLSNTEKKNMTEILSIIHSLSVKSSKYLIGNKNK